MITFKQYLNERTSNTNLVKMLEADCGPFLQAIKGNSRGFLYRGVTVNTSVAGVFKEIQLSDDPDDGTFFTITEKVIQHGLLKDQQQSYTLLGTITFITNLGGKLALTTRFLQQVIGIPQ